MNMREHKNMSGRIPEDSFLRCTPIAHRGLHNISQGIQENTYPAFQRAVDQGVAIETDIHLTADDELVLFHDINLEAITGDTRPIGDYTLAELKAVSLTKNGEKIPEFKEFLRFIDGRVPLLLELKWSHRRKTLVSKVLESLNEYKGEFAMQSFDPRIVHLIKKMAPDILRGQLACTHTEYANRFVDWILKKMPLNFINKPDFVNYNVSDLPKQLKTAKRARGTLLLGWTVRTLEELMRTCEYLDNIVFEYLSKAVMEKYSQLVKNVSATDYSDYMFATSADLSGRSDINF